MAKTVGLIIPCEPETVQETESETVPETVQETESETVQKPEETTEPPKRGKK